jgi:hypothetical protein
VRGLLTIIPVSGAVSSKELAAPPALKALQAGVGGYIQLVPYFLCYEGEPCIAFCDEEGKLNGLPVNERATALWHMLEPRFIRQDVLVGPIVIITGDQELMRAL